MSITTVQITCHYRLFKVLIPNQHIAWISDHQWNPMGTYGAHHCQLASDAPMLEVLSVQRSIFGTYLLCDIAYGILVPWACTTGHK